MKSVLVYYYSVNYTNTICDLYIFFAKFCKADKLARLAEIPEACRHGYSAFFHAFCRIPRTKSFRRRSAGMTLVAISAEVAR